MKKEMTWKNAIRKVLREADAPLHYQEITERIIADGLRESLGATPSATVSAQIASSIKHQGKESPYVRKGKGVFALADELEQPNESDEKEKAVGLDEGAEMEEEQYAVVSSFGMFWRREAVDWTSSPKLLGKQQLGATPVDFSKQVGLYLLYDGREVIYAGRTTDRPLGKRLFEHTRDRLSTRWNRFSWFGLLPVSEKGALGELPASFESSKIIPALEAILIEALEPRQNRKRGDDLAAAEYLQEEDPTIRKKRKHAVLTEAMEALGRT